MKIKKIKLKKMFERLKNLCAQNFLEIKNSKMVQKSVCFYKNYYALIDVLLIILYKLSLDVVYVIGLSPSYAYAGYITDIDLLRYLISFLTVVIFSIPITALYIQKTPSSIVVLLINLIYFIPFTTYFAFVDVGMVFFLMTIVYWAIFMVCQLKLPSLYLKKTDNRLSKGAFYIFMTLICLSVLYVWAKYANFRIQLDFINVYETRAEATTYNLNLILSYLQSFATTCIPVFILYFVQKRNKLFSCIMVFVWLCNFSIHASKTVFFMLFIVILSYIFYKDWSMKLFSLALIGITVLSGLIQVLFKNIYPISFFVRRVMFTPVQLSVQYYNFFCENRLDVFQSGLLNKVGFEKVYIYSISKIIGMYNGTGSSANNGLIGDAFSNLGIVGIFVMPIIIIVILKLLDAVSNNIEARVVVVICANFAIVFTNSSWSTVLLTHGYLATCLLLYLYSGKKKEISYEI